MVTFADQTLLSGEDGCPPLGPCLEGGCRERLLSYWQDGASPWPGRHVARPAALAPDALQMTLGLSPGTVHGGGSGWKLGLRPSHALILPLLQPLLRDPCRAAPPEEEHTDSGIYGKVRLLPLSHPQGLQSTGQAAQAALSR